MGKQYYIYIMANEINTVTYTGVTDDLLRRIYEHKNKIIDGFTKRYNITKLVYFETHENIENAIMREKQIKSWSRRDKVKLIKSINKDWHDLYDEL